MITSLYDKVLKKYLLIIDDVVIFVSSSKREINKKLKAILSK